MEKTGKLSAEDIIATLTVGGYANHGEYLYDAGEVKEAMRDYAVQELADYKAKLRAKVMDISKYDEDLKMKVIELIDKTDLT